MHLVGFIIRICHDARSPELQIIVLLSSAALLESIKFTTKCTKIGIKTVHKFLNKPTNFGAEVPTSASPKYKRVQSAIHQSVKYNAKCSDIQHINVMKCKGVVRVK